MGSTEYTEDDALSTGHVSFSEDEEVFCERTINFVKGAIKIISDVIEKNK